jgi:hypothetical protein
MAGPYIDDEIPPGIEFHATPRNAVIGTLRSVASVQDVADALTEAGIDPSTVHFVQGAGGVAFLERLGNWFTRARGEGLADARGSLESGATMVGVFEVAEPDAEAIRRTLFDVGVGSLHYFGETKRTRWSRASSHRAGPRPTPPVPSIDLSAISETYGFSAVPPSFSHPYFGRQPGRMLPMFTRSPSVAGTICARPPSVWHPYFVRQRGVWPLIAKPPSVSRTTIA